MSQSANSVYALIGRAVVGFVRYRYGREIRIAGAVAAVSAVALGAAYVATRDAADDV